MGKHEKISTSVSLNRRRKQEGKKKSQGGGKSLGLIRLSTMAKQETKKDPVAEGGTSMVFL